MSKTVMISVKTNKREYVIPAGTQVTWMPDEEVICIEVVEES